MNIKCVSCSAIIELYGEYIYRTSHFKDILRDNKLYKCSACELVQANHLDINPKELEEYYRKIYKKENHDLSPLKKPFWKWKGRGINFVWMINEYLPNKEEPLEIYELGSGDGFNVAEFKTAFVNSIIHKDDFDTDSLNSELPKLDLDVKGNYDIILLSHVLEHLIDPQAWVSRIIRCLKKEGILIIEVPNDNSSFVRRSFRYQTKQYDEPHISFFDSRSIVVLCNQFSTTIKIEDVYTSGVTFAERYLKAGIITRLVKKLQSFIDESKKNKSVYNNAQLISWFTDYLRNISRRIDSNSNPDKEGDLLRIVLRKL